MEQIGPTMLDLLGVVLLGALCGGVGALAGTGLVRRVFDWTPTSARRATLLGCPLGAAYPFVWIFAFGTLDRLSPWRVTSSFGGGVTAVFAATGTAAVLWVGLWTVERTDMDAVRPRGAVLFTASFVGVLAAAFAALLPVLFPVFV